MRDKSKILCLDIETTGLNRRDDEIIKISIINGNGDVLFNEYINPKNHKEWPAAAAVTGIYYEDVKDKPYIDEYIPLINKIIAGSEIIVGYNIINFDLGFIISSGITVPDYIEIYDVMLEFAPVYGEWNDYYENYKWQKLSTCKRYFGYKKASNFYPDLEDLFAILHCYFEMNV